LAAGELTNAQLAQIRSATQQRRVEFFSNEAGKPLVRREIKRNWNNRGDFTRHYAQSIVLFSMRAMELNEQINEANGALQELCQYHLDRPQTFFEIHSFPGVCDGLARLYKFYGRNGTRAPGRLSEETCLILERTMWEWLNQKAEIGDAEIEHSQTWWIENSENHHAQHFTTCWAFSQILKEVPEYRDRPFKDGHTPAEHGAAWTAYLREYLRQRACKGMFVEIDSPSYASATLKSMYYFYDFSDDPILKKRAGQLLDLYWTLWAEEQLDGVEGGAKARCYADAAVHGGSFLRRAGWYLIGVGDPGFVHNSMIPFVTTSWQAPDIVLQIAHNSQSRGVYEVRQRRMGLAVDGYDRPHDYRLRTDFGGIFRYTFCTPDFIMGSLITEARPTKDWAAISSQNRWSGVIFHGHPDARVFPAPYHSKGGSILNGFWSVQSKGTMISQQLSPRQIGNRSTAEAGTTQQWRVFFSTAGLSAPLQDGKWSFAEAENAYVGVCVVDDGGLFTQSRFGKWLVCNNPTTPVILEVARKCNYDDFAAFRRQVLLQSLVFLKSVLSYESLSGDKLTFYTDQTRLPEINGLPVNLAPDLAFDSPFVQSKWDSGIVTIRYGNLQSVLNFND
jgi:hypothetical protein